MQFLFFLKGPKDETRFHGSCRFTIVKTNIGCKSDFPGNIELSKVIGARIMDRHDGNDRGICRGSIALKIFPPGLGGRRGESNLETLVEMVWT